MLRDTGAADWHWVACFNARVMNATGESGGMLPAIADDSWGAFDVRLLPNKYCPNRFVLLRPVAILVASAKLWSSTMFLVLERYDTQCPSHPGFRRSYSCIGFVAIIRLLMERRSEVGLDTCMLQAEFEWVYDCIRHAAILVSLVKRGRGGIPAQSIPTDNLSQAAARQIRGRTNT